MSNVSKKWKSGTWRLGKTRTKEPEMVESPLPYNWSPGHEYERRQDHWSDSIKETVSKPHQGSLSESPEVREKLEKLATDNAKKPGHMRSDSAGSLHLSSHVSELLHLEEACNQLKDERDMLEQLFLAEQMKVCQRDEEIVAKEREFAEVAQKASRVVELERELKVSIELIAKHEQIFKEKLVEAQASADHIRTLEAKLQEVDQNMGELHKRSNQSTKNHATSPDVRNEEDQRMTNLDKATAGSSLETTRLQQEVAQFEARCAECKEKLELKTTEANVLKERVCQLEGELVRSEEATASVRRQLADLEEEVAKLQDDQVALQLQLELESTNHARIEEEWIMEREELEAQVAHLETEVQLASCSNGELDFLITPAKKGYSDGALGSSMGSPRTPNGLSIQTLLDMGEASLEVEEDIHELQLRLADAEVRERNAVHELALREQELQALREQNTQLKEEVVSEKDKAKDEAEDLTQEMAELRYQLMEMIEQERELRAQAEQASVLRVEELEAQVKDARQEVVLALARRREAEMQSDHWVLEIQHLRLALENADQELKEAKEIGRQAQLAVAAEAKQAIEAKLEAEKQVRELFAAYDCLCSENVQLKMSLDEAVATTAKLAQTLEKKESELCALLEQESKELGTTPSAENEAWSRQGRSGRKTGELGSPQTDGRHALEESETSSVEEKITLESVDEIKDNWALESEITADVPVQEIEENLFDYKVPEVGQACYGQGQETSVSINNHEEDPLLERVRAQVEILDELRLANEQLRVELKELQLQSVPDNDLDANESKIIPGPATENESEVGSAAAEPRDSDVDHNDIRTRMSTEMKQLRVELQGLQLEKSALQSELEVLAIETGIQSQSMSSGSREPGEAPGTPGLQDKFVCTTKQDQLWAVKEMAETVESITEELAKHLKLILKAPLSTKQDLAVELESRIRSWSNVSSKGLQTKLSFNGAVEEWGELAVDLLGQSRRELVTAHQKLLDCEVDLGYLESLRQERVAVSKEVTRLRDEIDRLEASHTSEMHCVTEELSILKKKLDAAKELELMLRSELAEAESEIQLLKRTEENHQVPSKTFVQDAYLLEAQESCQDVLG